MVCMILVPFWSPSWCLRATAFLRRFGVLRLRISSQNPGRERLRINRDKGSQIQVRDSRRARRCPIDTHVASEVCG